MWPPELGVGMQRREFITLVGSAAASWCSQRARSSRRQGSKGRFSISGTEPAGPSCRGPSERVARGGLCRASAGRSCSAGRGWRSLAHYAVGEGSRRLQRRYILRTRSRSATSDPGGQSDYSNSHARPGIGQVDIGLVASLAHPGGNVTGMFLAFADFATKWLGLLKETIPQLSRLAVNGIDRLGRCKKSRLKAQLKC